MHIVFLAAAISHRKECHATTMLPARVLLKKERQHKYGSFDECSSLQVAIRPPYLVWWPKDGRNAKLEKYSNTIAIRKLRLPLVRT